ncbi:MAG: glycosyltransferase [Frankiales bacterium]|nr:glycosyltransferase [Frankiales bacterium]
MSERDETASAGLTVSVCVVVKDRRELMLRCLDSIVTQFHAAAEIVVVDNGSTDGTFEAMAEAAGTVPNLRVVQDTGTLGRARNTAVRTATCDIVAFTDSDCTAEPDWLSAGLAPFADEEVGVVQGRTVPEHPPVARWSATQDIAEPSGLFEACNVFYRRRALISAGGFDEEVGFFGEDTAAGWSVLRAGWRDGWAPDAVVSHVVTTPGLGWHLRRARGYANWPSLLRRFPERRDLLWHGLFLRRRSAETDLALAGAVTAILLRRPEPLAALLPFAWRHRPRGVNRRALADSAGAAAFDLAVSAALLHGSLRERTPVL